MHMKGLSKDSAQWIAIDEADEGQRIDNFLVRILKGVPKSHVYRILRTGEVRINSRRAAPTSRLKAGDQIRLPPVRIAKPENVGPKRLPSGPRLDSHVLFEDDALLILNKPAGIAVHGGSGISLGVIERLRLERPAVRYLELVHRLDKDTSGILVLAKKRSALRALHEQLRDGSMDKSYLALVRGVWTDAKRNVKLALNKQLLPSGEKHVYVDQAEGVPAHTVFHKIKSFGEFTLLRADLLTGKTHQIRVHLAHLGFPIAGDEKYGDFQLNKTLGRAVLKRMFLHAEQLSFDHPATGERLTIVAPLPQELQRALSQLAETPPAGTKHGADHPKA